MNPKGPRPGNDAGECDCSGFACWALGVSRWTKATLHPWQDFVAEWISTTSIASDALKTLRRFRRVMVAEPGDLLVYGDRVSKAGKPQQGHVGICTQVGPKGPEMVVHCSSANYRRTNDAIRETDAAWWYLADGVVARCAWVEG